MLVSAISFDFGQTLAGLSSALLVEKVASRGFSLEADRVEASLGVGWDAYDRAVRAGVSGHPWRLFMSTVLTAAGCTRVDGDESLAELVEFLFEDQRRYNLWRAPIPGMIELCESLRARDIPIGILTNSEGRAEQLVEELGWRELFGVVVDSGRIGIEKPDPRIFHALAARLGVEPSRVAHVGDNFGADVEGALAAGMRAVWFRGRRDEAPEGVPVCATADELRAVLEAWLPPPQ